MAKQVELSSKEIDLLIRLLYGHNACANGCVYPQMQTSKIDCNKCNLPKHVDSIIYKLKEME